MITERRTILSLVAAGRISATEAERLLVLSEDHTEALWVLVACVAALVLMQSHPHAILSGALEPLRSLLSGVLAEMHQALDAITQLSGGVL